MIRGKLINFNSIMKRKRMEKNEQFQKKLEEIETHLKRRLGGKTLEKQRRLVKQRIVAFEMQVMVWVLKRSQQKVFEGSN